MAGEKVLADSSVVVRDIRVGVGDDDGFAIDLVAARLEVARHKVLVLHLLDVWIPEVNRQSVEDIVLERLP